MKNYILIICIFLSINSHSQEFMGIKVDGKKQELIPKFKEKGFNVVQESIANSLTMNGYINGTKCELLIFFTPKTKIAWKFVIYLDKQSSWYNIKSDYEKYLGVLTNKYGEPKDKYNFFESPYYEGDGYEMSAVRSDKCHYSAYWDNMMVEISKFEQVKIGYENPKNLEINKTEKLQIEKQTF